MSKFYTAPDGSLIPVTVCPPSKRLAASSIQSKQTRYAAPARGARFIAEQRGQMEQGMAAQVVGEVEGTVLLATPEGLVFQFTPGKEGE